MCPSSSPTTEDRIVRLARISLFGKSEILNEIELDLHITAVVKRNTTRQHVVDVTDAPPAQDDCD